MRFYEKISFCTNSKEQYLSINNKKSYKEI